MDRRHIAKRWEWDDDPLTHKIIGAAIEVHRQLGPGCLESPYEECLCLELAMLGVPFERQVPLPICVQVDKNSSRVQARLTRRQGRDRRAKNDRQDSAGPRSSATDLPSALGPGEGPSDQFQFRATHAGNPSFEQINSLTDLTVLPCVPTSGRTGQCEARSTTLTRLRKRFPDRRRSEFLSRAAAAFVSGPCLRRTSEARERIRNAMEPCMLRDARGSTPLFPRK